MFVYIIIFSIVNIKCSGFVIQSQRNLGFFEAHTYIYKLGFSGQVILHFWVNLASSSAPHFLRVKVCVFTNLA